MLAKTASYEMKCISLKICISLVNVYMELIKATYNVYFYKTL